MFENQVKIKFSNCDPAGVIYFPEVFNIAHETYELFMLDNNECIDYFRSEEMAIPITKAECLFNAAIALHDDIIVELSVLEIRECSFAIEYKFIGENGALKALVKTVHVCVDKQDHTKTFIPSALAEHLSGHLVG